VAATTMSQTLLLSVAAAAGVALCIVAGRRLLPRGMFTGRRPGVASAVGARFCASAAFGGIDVFVPLAAERIHGVQQAKWQGAVIVGAALTWTLGQALAARHADTMHVPRFVARGFLLLGLGGVLTATVAFADVPLIAIFAFWSIGGLGMGMLFNPTTVVAMGSTTEEDSGEVSSQLTMIDSLGFTATTAIGGTFVAIADRSSLSLRDALLISFAVSIALALYGGLRISRGVSEQARSAT
jgi:MFS family permease